MTQPIVVPDTVSGHQYRTRSITIDNPDSGDRTVTLKVEKITIRDIGGTSSATGEFLGVFTALGVVPSTAGSARRHTDGG